MKIRQLRQDIVDYLNEHNLGKKWSKAVSIFEINIRHRSLGVELLEPRWRGIYSFRLDKKYRALFFIEKEEVEVFQITNHYKK